MTITNSDGKVVFSIEMETAQVSAELIVLTLIAMSIEKLLGSNNNLSTRATRLLGHIRKVTNMFKHIPTKEG